MYLVASCNVLLACQRRRALHDLRLSCIFISRAAFPHPQLLDQVGSAGHGRLISDGQDHPLISASLTQNQFHACNLSSQRLVSYPTCMHTYIHTYIHIHTHTYILTYIHTYIYTCVHACMHTYVRSCIHACTGVCVYIDIHIQYTLALAHTDHIPFLWKRQLFCKLQHLPASPAKAAGIGVHEYSRNERRTCSQALYFTGSEKGTTRKVSCRCDIPKPYTLNRGFVSRYPSFGSFEGLAC